MSTTGTTGPEDPAQTLERPERDTAPHFSDMAEHYENYLRALQPPDSEINRWLGEHLGSGRRALDAGCGTGRLSVTLAERYEQVLAVDAAPGMIEIAARERPRDNITYQVRDIRALSPEHDGLFDAVLVFSCILHVGQAGPLLAHLRTLVAPGGTLVIAEPQRPPGWGTEGWRTEYAFRQARNVYESSGEVESAVIALRTLLSPAWYAATELSVPPTLEDFTRDFADALPGSVMIRTGEGLGIFLLSWRAPE